jgi:hypothetical protein
MLAASEMDMAGYLLGLLEAATGFPHSTQSAIDMTTMTVAMPLELILSLVSIISYIRAMPSVSRYYGNIASGALISKKVAQIGNLGRIEQNWGNPRDLRPF